MPRINTNRTVRIALWALRIYLLVLLSLIGLKFVRMSVGSGDKGKAEPGLSPPNAAKQTP
jgi:hypothetical protein